MYKSKAMVVIMSLVGAAAIHAVFAACATGSMDTSSAAASSETCACNGSAIQGAPGPRGAEGPQGPQGLQGLQGAPGAFAGQISLKPGDNGSAPCGVYCAGAQWGPTGTCVGAKIASGPSAGTYIDCATVAGTEVSCYCSRF